MKVSKAQTNQMFTLCIKYLDFIQFNFQFINKDWNEVCFNHTLCPRVELSQHLHGHMCVPPHDVQLIIKQLGQGEDDAELDESISANVVT